MTDVSAPSSPADRQKMKMMLSEVTNCMQRISDEKESIKEIVNEISGQFGVPKKIVNKVARTMFKRDFQDRVAEEEHFQELYETLVEGKTDKK